MNPKLLEFLHYKYHNPILNEDCIEIARDFLRLEPRGQIYTITCKKDPRFHTFVLYERGRPMHFHYHSVFVFEGLVFDPSTSPAPILLVEYEHYLRNLNPATPLKFEAGENTPY